jgi:hypothetical protein
MDDPQGQALERVHAPYAPVDARVEQLLGAIRSACQQKRPGESFNRSNERLAEEFATSLEAEFSGKVVVQRQRLSSWAIRTTRWNYLFTVPGESQDRIILVAHYDTWRGPGADDNTTGEEILKQYLLADLRSGRRPRLTHTYFLAGSEECGLVGLTSQILLALGLLAANLAVAQQDWLWAAAALATAPLTGYRFGVSGSREYVKTLSEEDHRRIRAVVAVDSVGEGRLYLPRGTMGADFIHTLIPFGDYDSLNDLLEEGAHLHGIKYNNYLAGGTTDHLSFLEVNNGLWHRAKEMVRRTAARLSRSRYMPPVRIPASALVAMLPGKASPLVFGGKIHTPNDTPDRVYPQPLRESLQVLDYFFYRMEGGERMREPRTLDEYHYARLYRVDGGHLLVLKDAIEHNRRNVNGVYRAQAVVEGKRATVEVGEIVTWGVHPRLRDQVAEACAQRGWAWQRERVDELAVSGEGLHLRFERRLTIWQRVAKSVHRWIADLDGFIKDWTFASYFILAYLLGQVLDVAFSGLFALWPASAVWFVDHATFAMVVIVILELALLVYLMARRIPTLVDNAYRHENRADNLGSLRRVAGAGNGERAGATRGVH